VYEGGTEGGREKRRNRKRKGDLEGVCVRERKREAKSNAML
jgi:hypothetical protein